jgi:hypothetical protein
MASPNPNTFSYWRDQGIVLPPYGSVTSAGTNSERYWSNQGTVMFPGIFFVTVTPTTSSAGFFPFM